MTIDGIMGAVDIATGNVPGVIMSGASLAAGLAMGVCKDFGNNTQQPQPATQP